MPDLIVADSGPIISLARANKLRLIPAVYPKIILPSAVWEEIVIKGKNKPGSAEIKEATWVSIQKPNNQIEIKKLKKQFGDGESEAMVLAQELKAIIMVDEWAVIKEARKRNLRVTSTLIILVEAKRQNLINSVKQELDELIGAGFRTTPELVQEVLKRAGE